MVDEVELVEVIKEVPRYVSQLKFNEFIHGIKSNNPVVSNIKLQEVRTEGLVILFQALKKNKHVKKIDFSGLEFSRGTIGFIADHLKENNIVCEIDFSNSNINDEWARMLHNASNNQKIVFIFDGCKYILGSFAQEWAEAKVVKKQLEKIKERYLALTENDSSRPIFLEYQELLKNNTSNNIASIEIVLARAEFSVFLASRPRYNAKKQCALLLHARTDYKAIESLSPGNKRAGDGFAMLECRLRGDLVGRPAFQVP